MNVVNVISARATKAPAKNLESPRARARPPCNQRRSSCRRSCSVIAARLEIEIRPNNQNQRLSTLSSEANCPAIFWLAITS